MLARREVTVLWALTLRVAWVPRGHDARGIHFELVSQPYPLDGGTCREGSI